MKNYRILTRLMLKNTLASMNPFAQGDLDEKKKKARARGIGLLALMLYGVGFMIWFEIQIYNATSALGNELMLPGMAILLGMMLTLILGLFQGLSELYQGKDAPFLAVLPLTSRQVYAARLTSLYISETAVNVLVVFPAFILYAVRSGNWIPTVLTAIPVWLLLAVLPLSIVALLSALLMRMSFFARNRETVVMVLTFGIAIAYSILITRLNSSNMSDDPAAAYAGLINNGLVEGFGRIFPPASWAVKALAGNAVMLLLLLGVSAAAAALVVCLIGPGYIEQAISTGEQTVGARNSKSDADMRTGTPIRALHRLEWRRMNRTPAWLFNGLAGVVMFPLMLGIGIVSGFSGAGETPSALIALVPHDAYIVCFGGLLCAMGGMVNPAVSTAVSREGGCWTFALSLPVDQEHRFTAKLLQGVEISAAASLLITVVVGILTKIGIGLLFSVFMMALMIDAAVCAVSLWYDATHPHFRWANENEAIKKNLNQLWGVLFWVVAIALCCVPLFFWLDKPVLLAVSMLGIAAAEMLLSLALLYRTARRMTMMED